MWIKMKETYSGVVGLYPKGMKYDLPETTVKQLPKSFYEKTVAPWNEQKDTSAIELALAKKIAANNIVFVGMLESAIEKAKPQLAELVTLDETKQTELDDANEAANAAARAAEEKNATAKDKAKVLNLGYIAEEKELEAQKVRGQLLIASADIGLIERELDEARRAVEEAEPAADEPVEPEQTGPESEQPPAETEQQQAETEQTGLESEQPTEPELPVPPEPEDLGEAEIPKENEGNGPEKEADKKPKRTSPKKS